MQYTYILVEGTNIYANVLDTDQLSVIRGSSFILKDAIKNLAKQFSDTLTPITTGASRGLFYTAKKVDIAQLVTDITIELEQPPFCYFTFAVEQCQAESLIQANEQLLTQLRFHQMSGITAVPDRLNDEDARGKHPCELEGGRVAANSLNRTVQNASRSLSLSVHDRWLYGRDKRQNFYLEEGDTNECEALHAYRFTDDLENLAAASNYPKLNNKIAVIYMDGNKFSTIQRQILQQAEEAGVDQIAAQQQFDCYVKDNRSTFLKEILLEMLPSETARFPDAITQNSVNDDVIRFETLLWGGDEMLFVLPAWSGFELLQSFFQVSAKWEIANKPLTHAAGIVFCSAKTPIRIIRDIAQSLADTIKDNLGEQREINSWDYMVLESIDYPVNNDISTFNQGRYGRTLTNRRPKYFSAAKDWVKAREDLTRLIKGELLSRRQLYRVVNAFNKQGSSGTISWDELANSKQLNKNTTGQEQAEHRLLMLLDRGQRNDLTKILPRLANNLFGIDIAQAEDRAWFWINLLELWDYMIPIPAREEG